MPGIYCILGDILTEFTPNTTGILKLMAQQELKYRKLDKELTYYDVLDDIFLTSRIVGERGGIHRTVFELLQTGVRTIRDYIFSKNFIVETAVNSASKAAYLSLLIKHNISEVERFDKDINLNLLEIRVPEYKKFKSIKKFDPEAYFYWYKCIEIIEQEVSGATS